jgi:gas vesicle protein
MSSEGDFFKGLLVGAVVGAAAGILLAPQSGEKTREDIKKFSGDLADKAQDLYASSRKKLEKKISYLKEAGKKIDFEAYKKLVENVVDEVKKDRDVAATTAKKVGEQLRNDWDEFKSGIS